MQKFLSILLLGIVFFTGCSSTTDKESKSSMKNAVKIAKEFLETNQPGYAAEQNLIRENGLLIKDFELLGQPQVKYPLIWQITLLPPEGKPVDWIGERVYVDAMKGKVIDSTAYPLFYSGRNERINYTSKIHAQWRGYFEDGETLVTIASEEGLKEFFKDYGTKSEFVVPRINVYQELALAFADQKVKNVYTNGNVLVIELTRDSGWVNVITIPYDNFKGDVLGISWTSESGEVLGSTNDFDEHIYPWLRKLKKHK